MHDAGVGIELSSYRDGAVGNTTKLEIEMEKGKPGSRNAMVEGAKS
jgi:hypothetical protein